MKCNWVTTVHDGHWLCTTCGYNQWGAYAPSECMEEESHKQLGKVRNDQRQKLFKDSYTEF